MKVYFTHSRTVPQKQLDLFLAYFKKNDIQLLARNIPSDPLQLNFSEAENLYVNNAKKIKNADIVITESSFISNDIGFEISQALLNKKPVIAFYNMSEQKEDPRHIRNVPIGLRGNKNRFLILKEYTYSNFEKMMNVALKTAKELTDTKFILIIPPAIDRYLEWNANERGLAKAEVTRDAIEKTMKSDKKYQEYLKQQTLPDIVV